MDEWIGVFRSSTAGAGPSAPSSSPSKKKDRSGQVEQEPASAKDRPPTKTETDALFPDATIADAIELDRAVDRLHQVLRCILEQGIAPHPVPPMTSRRPAARVAHLVWLVDQIGRIKRPIDTDLLRKAKRRADQIDRIMSVYSRPVRMVEKPVVCRSHQRAGLTAEVAQRYSRLQLCMWCGEFRAHNDELPDPELVEMHDRGIRITPAILREHALRKRAERKGHRRSSKKSDASRRGVAPRRR